MSISVFIESVEVVSRVDGKPWAVEMLFSRNLMNGVTAGVIMLVPHN